MSDKKIFIDISQREARSVITAINFLTDVVLPKISEGKQKKVVEVGITAEELSELYNFGFRLGELADEQAELEAIINAAEPETMNPEPETLN